MQFLLQVGLKLLFCAFDSMFIHGFMKCCASGKKRLVIPFVYLKMMYDTKKSFF